MENGGRRIRNITLYACGSCENNRKMVLKGQPDGKITFPALVAKLEHAKYGTILFDTGYSERVYQNGIVSKIYNLLNPTHVTREETIRYRMQEEGENVKYIILSHPHPDHIGCLKDFHHYRLIGTRDCLRSLRRAWITDLVFANQVPDPAYDIRYCRVKPLNLAERDCPEGRKAESLEGRKAGSRADGTNRKTARMLGAYFTEVYDIFRDGSIYGVRLDGHSKGQMGIYIPEYRLLLAADCSWGHFFAEQVEEMRLIPRLIQNRFGDYRDSISRVKAFEAAHPEVEVIYSHETFPEGIYEPET